MLLLYSYCVKVKVVHGFRSGLNMVIFACEFFFFAFQDESSFVEDFLRLFMASFKRFFRKFFVIDILNIVIYKGFLI